VQIVFCVLRFLRGQEKKMQNEQTEPEGVQMYIERFGLFIAKNIKNQKMEQTAPFSFEKNDFLFSDEIQIFVQIVFCVLRFFNVPESSEASGEYHQHGNKERTPHSSSYKTVNEPVAVVDRTLCNIYKFFHF
jgi:hypothetical protein